MKKMSVISSPIVEKKKPILSNSYTAEEMEELKTTQIMTVDNVNQILKGMDEQKLRKQSTDAVYQRQAKALAGFEK